MDSKTIPSALTQPTTLGSRVLWLVNKRRLKKWLWWCLAILLFVVCVFIEFQTSVIQSWIFTSTNERISFAIAEGDAFVRAGEYPRLNNGGLELDEDANHDQ